MEGILQQLSEYAASEVYPFHMPGHKRNMPEEISRLAGAAKLDITEIEGFDDLHAPKGILLEAQERAAAVFGADETFFLVNGSTAGILTAVSAAAPKGSRVIVARNCHKSVYHACFLRELHPVFLYPRTVREYGIADAIRPEQVEEALKDVPDIAAVIITSPTYDGVVSDIEKIADIVHRTGIPLIVDAAHGAHFGFSPLFPESPVRQGADLVVQSLHKTLPALTQTALLHVSGPLADREGVREFERIYQTSSPSYLLTGSIDACVRLLEKGECWDGFGDKLRLFYEKTAELKHIRVMNRDIMEKGCMKAFDAGKLLISVINTKITGNTLYKELLNRYYLQLEMASDTYVTAIVTPWDREEGLLRLAEALLEIDRETEIESDGREGQCLPGEEALTGKPYPELKTALPLHRALTAPKEFCPLRKAAGQTAGTYVNLYPPGIPLVIPGEVITEEVIKLIEMYVRQRLNVQGVENAGDSKGLTGDLQISILK